MFTSPVQVVPRAACSMKCPSGTGHALCGCGIGGQARRSARSVPKAVQKDEMFDKVVEAALDCRNVQEWEEDVWRMTMRGTRGYKQAAFKSKDKFYGSSSRVPAMTLSKKAKQSSTFDHKNGLIEDPLSFEVEKTRIRTTGLRSSIEAKKRFSYLVTSKRKCACKKSAAALNIMDGSTVASAEKHKGMASGQMTDLEKLSWPRSSQRIKIRISLTTQESILVSGEWETYTILLFLGSGVIFCSVKLMGQAQTKTMG
uniref:Uncharacterized protein n=1 Tax=Oryza glumipatula TaxID=40148 RepID=A0A0E0BPA9_9ORYZ